MKAGAVRTGLRAASGPLEVGGWPGEGREGRSWSAGPCRWAVESCSRL